MAQGWSYSCCACIQNSVVVCQNLFLCSGSFQPRLLQILCRTEHIPESSLFPYVSGLRTKKLDSAINMPNRRLEINKVVYEKYKQIRQLKLEYPLMAASGDQPGDK